MQLHHWDYFLMLCADLQQATRYVELSKDNFETYSTEFARLYLAAGSEIDVVAKLLCKQIAPTEKVRNIIEYRDTILRKYPDLPDVEIVLPRHLMTMTPWQEWKLGQNPPSWWSGYNKVKHERNRHYKEANLENTLHCVAGLFVLLGYFYDAELRNWEVTGFPDLMRFDNKHRINGIFIMRPVFGLPGTPKKDSPQ